VMKPALVLLACLLPSLLLAQRKLYVGAQGGFAILSGDGSSVLSSSSAATSLFDPSTGAAADVFVGFHAWNYVSLQANYIWNGNNVHLVSTVANSGGSSFYQEPERMTQNAVLGDALVYARKRASRIRPYFSEGVGFVRVSSQLTSGGIVKGTLPLPPSHSSEFSPALLTAVGIDFRLSHVWTFRYSFGQTISRNTFGPALSPPEDRIPKNYQNQFGFYRVF
jgi:hypothetical protein